MLQALLPDSGDLGDGIVLVLPQGGGGEVTPSSYLRCHERLELGDVSPAGGRNFSTELQGYLCRGDRRNEHTLNLLCLECE